MKKLFSVATALVLVGLLAGCATDAPMSQAAATSTPTPSATNPYGGFPVDPPADTEVILTVKGSKTLNYTMPQLKKLEQFEATLDEPFVHKTQKFQGVALETLFRAAGIQPTDKISTIALNDYKYVDTAENFTASRGFLALSRDGGLIAMDQGGPVRIVFPDGEKYSTFLDAWNWSLRTLEVTK